MGRRTLGVGLVATVLAAGAYAYTNSNTVSAGHAGDGTGVISGYKVTGVQYTLNSADPTLIEGVSFTLDAAASTVRASINGGGYAVCTSTNAPTDTTWDCALPDSAGVAAATDLTVVAAS